MKHWILLLVLSMALSAAAQVPTVKFSAGKRIVEQYESVQLFDSSTNNPVQWEWNIYDSTTYSSSGYYPNLAKGGVYSDPSGNGNDEFSKNPEFAFDVPGVYTVTLRCRNSSGWSTVLVKKGYIKCVWPTQYNLGFGTYGTNNDNIVESDYGTIFDDGGPNQNYGNAHGLNTRSYLLIRPCKAKKIILTMTQLKFADTTDVLYVYDGPEEDYSTRIAAWTKNNTGNRTVTATSGSMYIIFKSGLTGIDSGFAGSYTTELDTIPDTPGLSITRPGEVYNSTPVLFSANSTGISGTPTWNWKIENNQVPNNTRSYFRFTFYTDGKYQVCVQANHCFGSTRVCDSVEVVTPTKKTKLNFTKSVKFTNKGGAVVLTPIVDNANRFIWTITPKSWQLLSSLMPPSTKDSTAIYYNTAPGDSLPRPMIKFLDTVCYTIRLVAYHSLDPAVTGDTLIKANYICANDFRNVFGIFGKVYHDKNSDCQVSSGDRKLSDMRIRVYDSMDNLRGLTVTDAEGSFYVEEIKGKYRVKPDITGLPLKPACNSSIDTVVNITWQNRIDGLDFVLQCNPQFDTVDKVDLIASTLSPAGWVFPGQTHTLRMGIVYRTDQGNFCYGPKRLDSGYIKVKLSGKIANITVPQKSAIPDIISGNQFTYFVKDFKNFKTPLNLAIKMDTTASAQDSVWTELEVKTYGKDIDTTNNKRKRFYRVVNSYDPNMKEVYPENVRRGYNDWLTYTIHFQNTGTAPAFNIRLEDTLDMHLDLETFDVIDYSHPVRTSLKKNILKFYFDDIMLPDSTSDRKGSEGYVTYRVKPLKDLPKGTRIHNTAYIYFDYNKPVVTNTTLNEFVQQSSIYIPGIPGLKIYPNPGRGIYRLETGQPLTGRIEVYNAMGMQVLNGPLKEDQPVDIRNHPDGLYIFRIYVNDRVATAIVIKGTN